MEQLRPALPVHPGIYVNRLFSHQINEDEIGSNSERVEQWITFFEENITRCLSHFDKTLGALETLSFMNHLIEDQTNFEFKLSLQFWESIFRTGKPMIVADVTSAQKLLVLSVIYGKYPGMFIRSHTEFLQKIDTYVNENIMNDLFCHCLIKYERPSTIVRSFEWLTSDEIEVLIHAFKGLNMKFHPHFKSKISSREFMQLMSVETEYLRFENDVIIRSLIYSMLHEPGTNEGRLYGFLKSSPTFVMDPEQYLEDIRFWKKGFELIHSMRTHENFTNYTDCADYLDYMKYGTGEEYSLKGRTGASLLRAVNEWHGEIFTINHSQWEGYEWEPIDKPDIAFDNNGKEIFVNQLTSGAELKEEGALMKHCVITYAPMSKRGHCSIWSLKERTPKTKRLLTIEVNNNTILQARGEHNRTPSQKEINYIRDWAERMEFKINLIKNDY